MKAQYKIGTLVEFTIGTAATQTGVIEAQVIREDVISYFMKDADEANAVQEKDIIAAYRPVVKRAVKARKVNNAKRANKNKEATASVQ